MRNARVATLRIFISCDVNYYIIIFDGHVSELKDKLARDPLESV